MGGELEEKRKMLKRMELEVNIFRLETELLSLDEKKELLAKNILEQKQRLENGEY